MISPTHRRLTGRGWHSHVDSLNNRSPHSSQWAGWSVCSMKSLYPPQSRGRSCRSLLSRSSHGGRSETSELLGGFDKTADHGGNKMMGFELAALEE